MRFTRSLLLGAVGSLALALALPGVAAFASVRASSAKPAIIIGSENFEESTIVANIWSDVLTKAGYKVTVEPSLGARAIVVSAIEKGQINLEPDYAASLLDYLNNGDHRAGRGQHRHRRTRRPEGAGVVRGDRAAGLEGLGHQRVRRHQGHGAEGPPDHHLEPQALRQELRARRTAGVPGQRRLRARPQEGLRPQLQVGSRASTRPARSASPPSRTARSRWSSCSPVTATWCRTTSWP